MTLLKTTKREWANWHGFWKNEYSDFDDVTMVHVVKRRENEEIEATG